MTFEYCEERICASVIKRSVLVLVYWNCIPMKDKKSHQQLQKLPKLLMTYSGGNFSCHRHLSDIVYHVLMTWINGVPHGDPHNAPHGALRDVLRWSVDNSCDALGTYVDKSRRNSSQSEALRGPSQSQFLRLFLRTWLVKK